MVAPSRLAHVREACPSPARTRVASLVLWPRRRPGPPGDLARRQRVLGRGTQRVRVQCDVARRLRGRAQEAAGATCARRAQTVGLAPRRAQASPQGPGMRVCIRERPGAPLRAAARGRPWPLRRPRAGIALDLLLFITPARPAAPVNTFLQRVIHRPADSWSRPAGCAPGSGPGGGRLHGGGGSPKVGPGGISRAWTGPPSPSPPHPAPHPWGSPARGTIPSATPPPIPSAWISHLA